METARTGASHPSPKSLWRNLPALVIVAALAGASAGHAAEKCKAKIKPKSGAIEVQAKNVGANPVWSVEPAGAAIAFADEGTCFASGKLKKCHLGVVDTVTGVADLAAKTAPAKCQLCIRDDGGTECCISHIKKCSPAARTTDSSFPVADPRTLAGVPGLPCASQIGNEVFFEGCNVNVRDGSGDTGGAVNGLGNLIVGYDEDGGGDSKTGSHNLVIGRSHTYTSYAGLVAGFNNAVTGSDASVSGGSGGTASGFRSSVSGGSGNTASGNTSAVSGGTSNTASGTTSSVSGGQDNIADGLRSSICGGLDNRAPGSHGAVLGGTANDATGLRSAVAGGNNNLASGNLAVVTGGDTNVANGTESVVSGGFARFVGGTNDWGAGTDTTTSTSPFLADF